MPGTLGPNTNKGLGLWTDRRITIGPGPVGAQFFDLGPRGPESDIYRIDRSITFSSFPRYGPQPVLIDPPTQFDYPVFDRGTPPDQVQLYTWSWSYNLNLIGKDQLPTGEQVTDLTPAQRPPEQIQLHSWQWSYNLNLIGKDRLPAGQQSYILAPSQVTPEQTQLHSWQWSYNLNLIGKDRLPAGAQSYILAPSQVPPEQITLHSWQWQYNLNLIGQDRLPVRQQDWPNPIPPALLRDWIQNTNIALLAVAAPLPRNQFGCAIVTDLAPLDPRDYRTWISFYNLNLIGQDQLPFRQSDWPLTPAQGRSADLATWIDRTKFLLLKPTAQLDWPNPTSPARDPTLTSWAASYNLNLIGKDQLPFRQSDWPNPSVSIPAPLLRDWIQNVNLALLYPPQILTLPLVASRLSDLVPFGPAPLQQIAVYNYNQAFIPVPSAPTLVQRTLTGVGL